MPKLAEPSLHPTGCEEAPGPSWAVGLPFGALRGSGMRGANFG